MAEKTNFNYIDEFHDVFISCLWTKGILYIYIYNTLFSISQGLSINDHYNIKETNMKVFLGKQAYPSMNNRAVQYHVKEKVELMTPSRMRME